VLGVGVGVTEGDQPMVALGVIDGVGVGLTITVSISSSIDATATSKGVSSSMFKFAKRMKPAGWFVLLNESFHSSSPW